MTDPDPNDAIDKRIRHEGDDETTFVVEYHDAGDLIRDYNTELSSGRMFIPTQSEVASDAAVSVVLSFAGLLQPLHLEGRVAAIVNKKKQGKRGLQIELSEAAAARLGEHITRVEERDPNYVVRAVRVLVVDDNPHCAKLIQDGLRLAQRRAFDNQLAFDVPLAATAADALAFLRKKPIDLLIADIYLGGASGAVVIQHIRSSADLRSIPIIAISAGHDTATREAAIEAGADVFLEKPLRLRQIVGTVGDVLKLKQNDWHRK